MGLHGLLQGKLFFFCGLNVCKKNFRLSPLENWVPPPEKKSVDAHAYLVHTHIR
jgi:hypothetical protein